jgi:hypothetical protein
MTDASGRSTTAEKRVGIVVIVNPVKVPDVDALRALVDAKVRELDPDGGVVDVSWAETTEADPGTRQARASRSAGSIGASTFSSPATKRMP